MNDLRFALRQLLKQPGFTLIAVGILALGIGANSAVFTLINTFLLRPIVAHEPERLVGVYSQDQTRLSWRAFSHPNFLDVRRQTDLFEDVLAMSPNQVGLTEGDATRKLFAMNVSANYFSVFGEPLQVGRAFTSAEETAPAPVVVVSDRWWRARGADPEVVGRSVTVNGRAFTVIGVTARGFCGTVATFAPDLYFPLSFGVPATGSNPLLDRKEDRFILVGRLKPGLSIKQANSRLEVVSAQLAAAYPDANQDQQLSVAALPRMAISINPRNDRRNLGAISALLLGMAGAVLLIACLNLANLLLARGLARRKEIAVRLALGASRIRIVRQLLLEGLLLASLGSLAGLVLAVGSTGWLARGLSRIAPGELSLHTAPDVRVIAATLGFCLLATVFFALGPALRLSRLQLNLDLKEHAGEDAGSGRRGVRAPRHLLVIGQVALSLTLLVSAGLFGRGAHQAMTLDPGFEFDRGFYLELDAGLVGYDESKARQGFAGILDRVSAMAGVESASFAVTVPFGDMNLGESVQRAGAPLPPPLEAASPAEGLAIGANYNVIGPDYFRTLGIPLQRGREFTRGEFEPGAGPRVAVVNTALAARLWPGEESLGRRIQFAGRGPGGPDLGRSLDAQATTDPTLEIVGVVPPQRCGLFEPPDQPMIFVPYGQDFRSSLLLHVRVGPLMAVEPVLAGVREAVREVDPVLPVLSSRTLRHHVSASVQIYVVRMGALLFGTFGLVAVLLAVIGVYGVKACSVARRTREMGIRMALGAGAGVVVQQILREGAVLIGVGLAVGLVLAAVVARLLGRFLFEVRAFDPIVFLAALLLLAAAGMFACWVPARRAARVNPMVALRSE